MLNTIKFSVILLVLTMFLPPVSYAWDNQHGRDEGRSHHEHGYYAHRNPDLTLITGMDTIDSRVLIAADSDQTPEVVDQPATVLVDQPTVLADAGTPPIVESDTDIITVNVPNNAGGYIPVILRKWGNAYLGPQGELYYPFPQVWQLKAMYGV